MYHPLSYPQIFYTVVFLAPIICFIVAFLKNSTALSDFIYAYPSIFHFITLSRKIFRVGIYFFSISAIMAANDFYKFSKEILQKNPLKKSAFYSFLINIQRVTAYLFVTGCLGFVTYPETNTTYFHFIMEIIFFVNVLAYLIMYDIIIKWFKEKTLLNVFIFDAVIVFVVFSFIIMRVIMILRNDEEFFPILSMNEYLSFFLCLLKFPICGWEFQITQKSVFKFE